MEEIDIAFTHWVNQAQPLEEIIKVFKGGRRKALDREQMAVIRNQLKHAFTHGYARGVAAEVAKFPPPDPNLGPIR